MTIVMYHYIRPNDKEYPWFNSLDIDQFKRQLNYFKNHSRFLSKDEFFSSIESGRNIDGVVLTFDDGFKDHYKYVLPELTKAGLWGIFYIPTNIYTSVEKKLLGVHRIHQLKGKYGASKILKEALKVIDSDMLDHETIDDFDREIYTYSEYAGDELKLRRMFNYYVKYEYRDKLLDKLMIEYFDESELAESFYLDSNEISELALGGNLIGSHTVSHKVLSRLSYQEQHNEIKASFEYLNTIVDLPELLFCYPYGYNTSYNENTLEILQSLNVHNAVIFDNKIQDDEIKHLELSRIDCNKFLGV